MGRALRVLSTTLLWALSSLLETPAARAEPRARFADVPSVPAPSSSSGESATQANAATAEATRPPPTRASTTAPPAPFTKSAPPAPESWSRQLARAHLERARELERRGDIAQALSEYTASLAGDSTLGEAYLGLGALRERMGDAREAELVYSEGVRLGDRPVRSLVQRSRLYRALGHSQEALRDLEAAVSLEPNREALEELAHRYVEVHAFSAALFTFRRILVSAQDSGDNAGLETARLEVRALRMLAAETDPTTEPAAKHDWVGRSLVSIATR